MKKKLALTKPSTAPILALPPTAPPPRKEDIINAMVERARVRHGEEHSRLEKLRSEAKEKFEAAVMKELQTNPENFSIRVHDYNAPEVEYTMQIVPPEIAKLKQALRQVPTMRYFDEAAVKRKIREQYSVTTGERVKALLANPDAVRALDTALDSLG